MMREQGGIAIFPCSPPFAMLGASLQATRGAMILGGPATGDWIESVGAIANVTDFRACSLRLADDNSAIVICYPEIYLVRPQDAILVTYRGIDRWFSIAESYFAAKYRLPIFVPQHWTEDAVFDRRFPPPPERGDIESVRACQTELLQALAPVSSRTVPTLPAAAFLATRDGTRQRFMSIIYKLRTAALRGLDISGRRITVRTIDELLKTYNANNRSLKPVNLDP